MIKRKIRRSRHCSLVAVRRWRWAGLRCIGARRDQSARVEERLDFFASPRISYCVVRKSKVRVALLQLLDELSRSRVHQAQLALLLESSEEERALRYWCFVRSVVRGPHTQVSARRHTHCSIYAVHHRASWNVKFLHGAAGAKSAGGAAAACTHSRTVSSIAPAETHVYSCRE